MAYKDILSAAIKRSDLSLREIAERCNELGQPISASYLSQLQTGKLPPPSEEVSITLAKVCEIHDVVGLIFEGYMEKAPAVVRYFLTATSEVNKQVLEILGKELSLNIAPKYIEYLDTFSRLGSTISYTEKLKRGKKIKGNIDAYSLVREEYFKSYGIDEIEKVFMDDNAMEPMIPKNAKLHVKLIHPDELKENDVIALKVNNKLTARRYTQFNNVISLIPENKSYEIIHETDFLNLDYFGKVMAYTYTSMIT